MPVLCASVSKQTSSMTCRLLNDAAEKQVLMRGSGRIAMCLGRLRVCTSSPSRNLVGRGVSRVFLGELAHVFCQVTVMDVIMVTELVLRQLQGL